MSDTLGLAELGDAALDSQPSRPVAPRIRIEMNDKGWGPGGWSFVCPYVREDKERWEAMLFEAFGTRSISVMEHFLHTISEIVGDGSWNEEKKVWMPRERDFQAAVNIINALDPQDEAQAAYAAQLLVLHLAAMSLSRHCTKTYADTRSTAVLAKTVRAYGDGMERLARLQGKVQPKHVKQTIQVVYVDQRDQRSVHFSGGVPRNGGQPCGADGAPVAECTALPCPEPERAAMPIAGSEGKASVPLTWWRSWLRSALRRT